jgi:hypothetical protein
MRWVCICCAAFKTTTKAGRTVDKEEVTSGLLTSNILNCYKHTNGKYDIEKEQVLNALQTLQADSNVLFVRLQVNFPYPTMNCPEVQLPAPGDIRRNKVTINWGTHPIQYYELIVAVDFDTAPALGIFSTDLEFDKSIWCTGINI